jgi:hypothetical protein
MARPTGFYAGVASPPRISLWISRKYTQYARPVLSGTPPDTRAECSCEGPFGTSRILQTIEEGRNRTLRQSVDDIIERVRDWSSTARLEDDASLLALEVG